MNFARSVLKKEIWSRRTDKLLMGIVVALVLGACLAVFLMLNWLSSIGKRGARAALKIAEANRSAVRMQDVRRHTDVGTKGFTYRDHVVISLAENLADTADLCRSYELQPNPRWAEGTSYVSFGKWSCSYYDELHGKLQGVIASKTGF